MSQQNQVEFTLWLRENQKAFLRAAKVICFDTQNAEDVLQEALADVYKRWSKIRSHENPEAYLMRVMVSKHADMRRKWLRRQQEKETSWDLAENIRDLVDQTDDVTQRLLVQAALKSLSKAAVAAYVELVPELEKSANKELTGSSQRPSEIETVIAEVVDNNE